MNILIFSWRDPKNPKAGGAEIVTHEHAKAWHKAGHNITLFTSNFKGAKSREILDGITIIRKGNPVFTVYIKAFLWYMFQKHDKFDLIIDHFHGISFFTPLYIKEKKIAFIHEVAKDVWRLNPWPKPLHIIPFILGIVGEPWIFKLYRRITFLTVSESTKKDLIAWGIPENNINIIHNGINISHPALPGKEKRETIIFLGALEKDKGIEDAFKVFKYLKNKEPGWQFWIVGKGQEKYKEILNQDIKYWGHVSEKVKFDILSRAHVLINPSIREGWGLVNLEANAMGTPVIAYDVPGCRDSVKQNETGFLVRPGDYKNLAEKTIELISNKILYEKFRKNAISWSKNFNWEKSTERSTTFINSL